MKVRVYPDLTKLFRKLYEIKGRYENYKNLIVITQYKDRIQGHSSNTQFLMVIKELIKKNTKLNKRNDKHFNNRDYSLFLLMGIFLKHL